MILGSIFNTVKKGANYYTRFASALTRGLDSSTAALTDAANGTLGWIQHATLGSLGPEWRKTADRLLKNEIGNTIREGSRRSTTEFADSATAVLDPDYDLEAGRRWEGVVETLGAAGGHLAQQLGLAVLTSGSSVLWQVGAQVLFNGAVSSGVQSVRKYDEELKKGTNPAVAADRAALVGVQSFGVGALEGGVDALLLGLTRWVPPVRNVPALAALKKIGERMPRSVRVGGATVGGAVGEGLAEGLADVAYEDIYSAADRGELFDPARATRSLFNDPAMQKQFWESFALGAVIGGGLKGVVSLAETSPVVARDFVAKVAEDGAFPEITGQLMEADVAEQRETVTTALYRAVANKNADLPDWVTYGAITRSGKSGTVDDVLRKVLKREEYIRDADYGAIALPSRTEVMQEVVNMDAVGRAAEAGELFRAERDARLRADEDARVREEQAREMAMLAEPRGVSEVRGDGSVVTEPSAVGTLTLGDFNLEKVKRQQFTPEAVRAAATAGREGVYTDTGESIIFDQSRVRRVLGDKAVGDLQEQHRAQFRERVMEQVPSLREAEVAFVDGLVDGKGIGAYLGGGEIKISKDNERWNTLAHEGAHHYFDTGMDTAAKNRAVQAIKAEYGQDVQSVMERHNIGENEAIKEVFAEKFGDWAAQDAKPKSFLERIWARLRDILRDFVENPDIRRIYKDFARGEGRLSMARADAEARGMNERTAVEKMREDFYADGLRLPWSRLPADMSLMDDPNVVRDLSAQFDVSEDALYQRDGFSDEQKRLIEMSLVRKPLIAGEVEKGVRVYAMSAVEGEPGVVYEAKGDEVYHLGKEGEGERRLFLDLESAEKVAEYFNVPPRSLWMSRNAEFNTLWDEDVWGSRGANTGEALYQRGDGEMGLLEQIAVRVEARDGGVPSERVVRKELLKGLLAYRAVEPMSIGKADYYPVYINVGDGQFVEGQVRSTMMAGWYSLVYGDDGAVSVSGVGVRKWAEGEGRGDVRFDSHDPVMYEKVADVLVEHLAREGVSDVGWTAAGDLAEKVAKYLQVKRGRLTVQPDWAVLPMDEELGESPLYQREKLEGFAAKRAKELGFDESDLTEAERTGEALTGKLAKGDDASVESLAKKEWGAMFRRNLRSTPKVLERLNEDLYGRFIRMVHNNLTRVREEVEAVDFNDVWKKYRAMPKVAQKAFKVDVDTIDIDNPNDPALQLAEQYGFKEGLIKMRNRLEEMYKELDKYGIDVGYRENYWPRLFKKKEMEKLMAAEPESAVVALSIRTQEQIYGQSLRSIWRNLQQRLAKEVTKENVDNYADPFVAYRSYVRGMQIVKGYLEFFGNDTEIDTESKVVNVTASIWNVNNRLIMDEGLTIAESDELVSTLETILNPLKPRDAYWANKALEAKSFSYLGTLMDWTGIVRDLETLGRLALRGQKKGLRSVVRATGEVVGKVVTGRGGELATPRKRSLGEFDDEFYAGEAGGLLTKITQKMFGLSVREAAERLNRTIASHEAFITWNRYIKDGDVDGLKRFTNMVKKDGGEYLIPKEQQEQTIEDIKNRELSYNVRLLLFDYERKAFVNSEYENPAQWKNPFKRLMTVMMSEQIKAWNQVFIDYPKAVIAQDGKIKGIPKVVVGVLLQAMLAGAPWEMLVFIIRNKRFPKAEEIPLFMVDSVLRFVGTDSFALRELREGNIKEFAYGFVPGSQIIFKPFEEIAKFAVAMAKGERVRPDTKQATVDRLVRGWIPLVGPLYYWLLSPTNERNIKERRQAVNHDVLEGAWHRLWGIRPKKKRSVLRRGKRGGGGPLSGSGLGDIDVGLPDLSDMFDVSEHLDL